MKDTERETIEMFIRIAVPRIFRDRANPIDILDDRAFRERFRLSRNGFYHVLGIVSEDLTPNTVRSASLPAALRLAIFLETIESANNQRITP
ncbi:hypothetical protein ANCDUO_10351 [Ancylostoma duodenale]|uniref:Uncharacterized protein n=1 Tax=Ancylostoma duodenale TaxID=51022 RepID=A0A0C2GE34_9BILA|nr:hypothetical protein ANCDUO_10351 [Ancylostoma duodenale]